MCFQVLSDIDCYFLYLFRDFAKIFWLFEKSDFLKRYFETPVTNDISLFKEIDVKWILMMRDGHVFDVREMQRRGREEIDE